MNLVDLIARMISPVHTRVANLFARAVLSRADDDKEIQELQLGILDGETRDGIERFQEYGFTSVPEDGAEAAVLFVGGHRDHGIAVAVDDRRYRPTGLAGGEVCLYHKDGARVHFKADGSVEIIPKSGQDVRIGSADASKALALAEKVHTELDAIRTALSGHSHTGDIVIATLKCTTTATIVPITTPPRGDTGSATVLAKD
jgi:phage baseplate assembly protein V